MPAIAPPPFDALVAYGMAGLVTAAIFGHIVVTRKLLAR